MTANYLDQLKDAYDDSFPYALDNRLIINWYPERIISRVPGGSLLEMGVGHGFCSLRLAGHFKRHIIIEGSGQIIEKFRTEACGIEHIEIIQTFFEDFTSEEKFDVILMGFVLEHVEDPNFIVDKFRSFLKPNGSIFITVPNAHALNKRLGYEAGMITDLDTLSEADLALGHKRLFTVDSIRDLAEKNGCRIDMLEGLFLKPIATQQIHDLKLSEEILQAMLKVGVNYPDLCVGILAEVKRL
jgi:2-polyprenyl-3-methyl-5-hydroxy-6-metoxy-1,4-benzoquinol methylase